MKAKGSSYRGEIVAPINPLWQVGCALCDANQILVLPGKCITADEAEYAAHESKTLDGWAKKKVTKRVHKGEITDKLLWHCPKCKDKNNPE